MMQNQLNNLDHQGIKKQNKFKQISNLITNQQNQLSSKVLEEK
jgi:hypothetical protein